MKKNIVLTLIIIFYNSFSYAQVIIGNDSRRLINIKYFQADSVILAFNDKFELIEDSCRQIIRYAHLNKQRKFFGKIKDLSSVNPNQIITEGNYSTDGLKNGYFTTHYLNGMLQAKGSFKNNEYDGKWEIYYDNGNPKLFFEASGKNIKITDAWDEKGKKTIDNGKGNYQFSTGFTYWKGKLLNGRPDGKWTLIITPNNSELANEIYKNGVFQIGETSIEKYTDLSRMELTPNYILPFTNAELMRVSFVPCGGKNYEFIVSARYEPGTASFTENIERLITPFLSTIDIKSYKNKFTIEGIVNETGAIVNLNSKDAESISRGLIRELRELPPLQPATKGGKPIKQGFVISFEFENGFYRFSYKFLPIR